MPEPAQPGKQELLYGELIQWPPAKDVHNTICYSIFLLFHALLGGRSRVERGFQLAVDTRLQADVSVTWPDQRKENGNMQGSPMIAVEVVSPGNTADEIDLKTIPYLERGAAEVWIVYPRARRMMVHKPNSVETITDTYTWQTVPVMVKLSEILG